MEEQNEPNKERETTFEQAKAITLEILRLVNSSSKNFWEIATKLEIMKTTKGYTFIDNPKTRCKFRSFEDYCVVYLDLARNTVFNYLKALEYVREYHPDVHPGEQIDYSKIALLNSINKDAHYVEWKELDNKVFSNKITKRELEEEISIIKKNDKQEIDTTRLCPYDSNLYYYVRKRPRVYDEDVICVDVSRNQAIAIFKNKIPTVTRFCTFLHNNGIEFSIREYARAQEFPDTFKFVGSLKDMRDQIGEAVSPKMGEHVIKKYIKGVNYIELFCGAGGFSLGAHNCGKKCLWGIDVNRSSCHSFKLNFPEAKVCHNDIRKIDPHEILKEIGKVDFMIGGPPCQGFSIAGAKLSFEEDPRNNLYLEYIRFLSIFKPSQFIMENVTPILSYKEKIISDFEKIGYSVQIELVKGNQIGMIQDRHRVFFVGTLKTTGGEK